MKQHHMFVAVAFATLSMFILSGCSGGKSEQDSIATQQKWSDACFNAKRSHIKNLNAEEMLALPTQPKGSVRAEAWYAKLCALPLDKEGPSQQQIKSNQGL